MRARVAAAALLAYPRAYREVHGPELVSTLLDSSAGSWRRFAREVLDLVRLGLRARAARTASAGATRLVADGACLAASWFVVLDLSAQIAKRMSGDPDRVLAVPTLALIAATLLLGLVGYDRLAGVAGLVYTLIGIRELLPHEHSNVVLWSCVVPVACFVVMVLAPRRRPRDLRRAAWIVLAPAMAAVALGDGDPSALTVLAALVFLFLPALATLLTDPRRAIACALLTTEVGMIIAAHRVSDVAAVWFLAATPLVLAVAITRTRRLQRNAAI